MHRSSTALPSSKKTHSERHKQILKQLLKEDDNRVCVDCKTSAHPRWASWNLGCFICIRCSGIHRSMGVHISKVKSVDLDAWTDEQVESMVRWGNKRCNLFWESKLPEGYVPDQSKIENFIRTKYDMRKWAASATVPDPSTLGGGGTTPTTTTSSTLPHSKSVQPSHNLLDDDFGSFTSASVSTPGSVSAPSVIKSTTSKHPPVPPKPSSPIVASPQSTGGSMSGRPDLKKSILSLYSSPSSSNSSFVQPQQPQYYQQRQQTPQHTPPKQVDLATSLQGLSFGGPASAASSRTSTNSSSSAAQSTPSTQAPAGWNNEWSDMSSNTQPPSNKIRTDVLDDDLFKNVWK